MTEHFTAVKKLFFLRFFSLNCRLSVTGFTLFPLGPIYVVVPCDAAAADKSVQLPELLISCELLLSVDTFATSYASSNLIVPLRRVLASFVCPTVMLLSPRVCSF